MQQQENDDDSGADDVTPSGDANLADETSGRIRIGPIIFALVGLLALAAFINYMWRDHTKSNNLPPAQASPSSLGVGTTASLPPAAQWMSAPLVAAPDVAQSSPPTGTALENSPRDIAKQVLPSIELLVVDRRSDIAPATKPDTPPIAVKPEDAEAALREAEKNLAEMVAKLAPAVDGPVLVESTVDGEFEGWDGDTIFKLSNGQIWQQATYAYAYHYAFCPKVRIIKTNGAYKLSVDGISDTICVKRLEESDVIESTIDGAFSGWNGETIFKLANGQIWQQAMYTYTYHYAFRPKVLIIKTNGIYKMKVGGVSGTIFVKRLK